MGLKCDQTIVLTGTHTPCYYPEKLRRNLRIKAFFGTFENTVTTRIRIVISVYTLLIPIFRFFIQPMSSKRFVSKERNSRWYLLGFRKNSSQAALNSANVS